MGHFQLPFLDPKPCPVCRTFQIIATMAPSQPRPFASFIYLPSSTSRIRYSRSIFSRPPEERVSAPGLFGFRRRPHQLRRLSRGHSGATAVFFAYGLMEVPGPRLTDGWTSGDQRLSLRGPIKSHNPASVRPLIPRMLLQVRRLLPRAATFRRGSSALGGLSLSTNAVLKFPINIVLQHCRHPFYRLLRPDFIASPLPFDSTTSRCRSFFHRSFFVQRKLFRHPPFPTSTKSPVVTDPSFPHSAGHSPVR